VAKLLGAQPKSEKSVGTTTKVLFEGATSVKVAKKNLNIPLARVVREREVVIRGVGRREYTTSYYENRVEV
jgi:hypothetical protein